MKRNLAGLLILLLCATSFAATKPDKLFPALEQRLHSLKSLEIQYRAEGGESGDEVIQGRMIWVRPDRFYHDTPEWTLVEIDGEQWRLLKEQGTLIREIVQDKNDYSPQHVLFNLRKSFRLKSLDLHDDGRRILTLESLDSNIPGSASLEFPEQSDVPDVLQFTQADGSYIRYQISGWNENITPDPELFNAPTVAPENVIDFRDAGTDR
jgi:outer membrane lipoprotein-sorting protein